MLINDVTGAIVNSAMKVHSVLGPGLLERAYQVCLARELRNRGLAVRSEVFFPVKYEGVEVDLAYRLDLLVEEEVVVEVKATAKLLPVHEAQLVSQLKLSGKRVGLLINFHVLRLRDGIVRKANRL